jgi:2-hydroxychromene-2-carboxylate isomerase
MFLSEAIVRALSAEALARRRARLEARRIRRRRDHEVVLFCEAGDPYSCLAAQAATLLEERFHVRIRGCLVSAPGGALVADQDRHKAYALRDAAQLAKMAGFACPSEGKAPGREAIEATESALASAFASGGSLRPAADRLAALWEGRSVDDGHAGDAVAAKARGDRLRRRLGHFMSGVFYYEGEWYPHLDRLHYLEARLDALGLRRNSGETRPIFAPPVILGQPDDGRRIFEGTGESLDFFLSFRSPYTYLATRRVRALADRWGLDLRLHYVLPMVMRGLPVPRTKGLYFLADCAREARRIGEPFGKIADPVGRPVERGYALLEAAIEQGRGYEFAQSFLSGVWSEGVDAGSERGLRHITERAGLPWRALSQRVDDPDWRRKAEVSRLTLLDAGLWGVPCFRFRNVWAWGQDRLGVIETAIRSAAREREQDAGL